MNIAFISEHASPLAVQGGADSGGQNVYVGYVARELGRAGHTVDVFTRRDDPALPHVIDFSPGVRVYPVPAGPAAPLPKEKLLPFMREFGERIVAHCAQASRPYDVTHANFFMSGLAGLQLREAFGVPLVITFHALGKIRRQHQGEADGFPDSRLHIEEMLVTCADRIIAECPQDREDLIKLYGADERLISTIPCGVDLDELAPGKPSVRERMGLAPDDFVVLQLGRLVPRKGIDNVIVALGELRRRHGVQARLLVVGGESADPDDGRTPEISRLRAVARAAGVDAQVQFTGRRERSTLRDYYAAADVFVTTPWYETFGIAPLEAMACARPVIGAAVGGIRHTVVQGTTGYLVPPRDPGVLADRLALLYRDPEAARALGLAGMRRVRRYFTWDRVAASLLGVYGGLQEARTVQLTERMTAP